MLNLQQNLYYSVNSQNEVYVFTQPVLLWTKILYINYQYSMCVLTCIFANTPPEEWIICK